MANRSVAKPEPFKTKWPPCLFTSCQKVYVPDCWLLFGFSQQCQDNFTTSVIENNRPLYWPHFLCITTEDLLVQRSGMLSSHQNLNLSVKNDHLLVSIRTYSSSFIIFGTVNIRAVVKRPFPPSNWSSSTLVKKMPMETRKGTVLCAFMLQK